MREGTRRPNLLIILPIFSFFPIWVLSSKDTLLGASKADLTKIFSIVFLSIFAGLILLIIAQANFEDVTISGSIDVNYIFGIFTGIVIAVIGFLGITRNRATTPGTT